ncbi:putative BTB/POZ domain-containing protein [Cotonvirus japonicus]|uniref:BTB/POZ domain-containing protein n=1 Tax=Cotonvirus japonicus TaxID=2811091 RepID=A0ABM7NQW2_9VIRU|nr:putative BTB/POZ domain-containing protein [Cotonvirus japonicus]BCS82545.1 putative BTB/POZ domain-containing protein [Cotonvirus japonicus]
MNLISSDNSITKDFCQAFDSEFLSDVKIILVNDKKQLSLNLHRIVLSTRCNFFEKMFSNFNQQFENIVQVIDVDIAKDVIKFIYGFELNQPDNWQYKLKYYICCDYFGLNCQLPTDIKVSSDCFDNLLDLIEIIGYTDETIKILANNIPHDYDISTLPFELVKELNNYIHSSDMVIMYQKNKNINTFDRTIDIDIVNKDTKQMEKIYSKEYCRNLCYLSNIDKIAFTVSNTLFIYDLNTKTTQEHKADNITFELLIYNWVKNELIVCIYNTKEKTRSIHIMCVNTWDITETIYHPYSNGEIKNICLSSSCDKLAYVLEKNYSDTRKTRDYINEYIQVYDFETKKHTLIYKSNYYRITKLKFIDDDTFIICYLGYDFDIKTEIRLYNILGKGEIIYAIDNINDFDVYLDRYLLIVTNTQYILYDFIEKKIIHEYPININKIKVIPNGKMITYGYGPTTIYDIMEGKNSAQKLDFTNVHNFCFVNFQTSFKKIIENYLAQ